MMAYPAFSNPEGDAGELTRRVTAVVRGARNVFPPGAVHCEPLEVFEDVVVAFDAAAAVDERSNAVPAPAQRQAYGVDQERRIQDASARKAGDRLDVLRDDLKIAIVLRTVVSGRDVRVGGVALVHVAQAFEDRHDARIREAFDRLQDGQRIALVLHLANLTREQERREHQSEQRNRRGYGR